MVLSAAEAASCSTVTPGLSPSATVAPGVASRTYQHSVLPRGWPMACAWASSGWTWTESLSLGKRSLTRRGNSGTADGLRISPANSATAEARVRPASGPVSMRQAGPVSQASPTSWSVPVSAYQGRRLGRPQTRSLKNGERRKGASGVVAECRLECWLPSIVFLRGSFRVELLALRSTARRADPQCRRRLALSAVSLYCKSQGTEATSHCRVARTVRLRSGPIVLCAVWNERGGGEKAHGSSSVLGRRTRKPSQTSCFPRTARGQGNRHISSPTPDSLATSWNWFAA